MGAGQSFNYGCGESSPEIIGATAVGTTNTAGIASLDLHKKSFFASLASKVLAAATAEGAAGGDATYDALLTPSGYSVGLQYVKLYLTTDAAGAPSYTIFDTGDISNPQILDLVTGVTGTFGSNGNYPPAGTYDRDMVLISYLELTLPVDGVTGTYRVYMSTVGSNQQGEVKYNDSGTWKWIDSTDGSYDTVRANATTALQMDLTGQPDPYVETFSFTSSFTVPANPTGRYTATITFDCSNTWFWDDNDADGAFEPAGDDWQTAGNPLDTTGFTFYPGPPAQTVVITHAG